MTPPRSQRLLSLPRSFPLTLRELGVDVDALAREVGAESALARMTVAQADALLDRAFARIEDPASGLRVGARVQPELFGLAGLSAMAAPTFGAALARIERYKRLCSTDAIALVPQGDSTLVRILVARPEAPHARLRVDMECAFLVSFGRVMTRTRLVPREVLLRGPAPAHLAQYEALFSCPVHFDQPDDAVRFSALDMARPLVSGSSELGEVFTAQAERVLVETGGADLVEQVLAVLRRLLNGEEPTLASVARGLGVSERSLQRKLGEASTSFAELLTQVRRDIARERLAQTDMDLAELSFLLGFSDPNSLHRAFKRWEGMTPLEYRRAAQRAG